MTQISFNLFPIMPLLLMTIVNCLWNWWQPFTKKLRVKIKRFNMTYKCTLDDIYTKVNVLKEAFYLVHDYNSIKYVNL